MSVRPQRVGKDPLWPAGHLPHKGEETEGRAARFPFSFSYADTSLIRCLSIGSERVPHGLSPLVGEMAGRPEGVLGGSGWQMGVAP